MCRKRLILTLVHSPLDVRYSALSSQVELFWVVALCSRLLVVY